jgi:hypothetical protein
MASLHLNNNYSQALCVTELTLVREETALDQFQTTKCSEYRWQIAKTGQRWPLKVNNGK